MKKINGAIFTILSAVTFGFAFTLAPMTYGDEGSNPVTLTFLRNFLSLPILFCILIYQKESIKVNKKQLKDLVLLSGLGTSITNLLMNMAFVYVDVGVVTTLHFVYPMFVTLGSLLFLREKLNPIKVIALLITTSGIGCFFLGADNSTSQNVWLGIVMALTSGITYAFYMIFIDKSGLKNLNPIKVTFYVAAVSSVVMLFYGTLTKSLVFEILSPKAWVISAIFSVLCTVIALSLIQVGIKNTGPSTAAILSTFEPITSVVFGSLLLGESVTIIKVIACLLIFSGILVLAFAETKNLKKF